MILSFIILDFSSTNYYFFKQLDHFLVKKIFKNKIGPKQPSRNSSLSDFYSNSVSKMLVECRQISRFDQNMIADWYQLYSVDRICISHNQRANGQQKLSRTFQETHESQ